MKDPQIDALFMKCMAAAATTVVVGQNVSSASALNSSIIGRLNSADGAYAETASI